MVDDIADDIAEQAVATPSLDASGALDVLVDILLQRGVIRPPWGTTARWRNERARARDAKRAHGHLRQQAWEWARRVTHRPAVSKFRQLVEMMRAGLITMPDARRFADIPDTPGDDMADAAALAWLARDT